MTQTPDNGRRTGNGGETAGCKAGRVPNRGVLVARPDPRLTYEVMEADPRRIKGLRIHNLPSPPQAEANA